ncbi:sugar ABC transporter ATP-binding protein [Brucellaceae bacterium C25G]
MTLLQAHGLTKSFPGVVALNDVSLSVKPGEVHCIVGENGAGKSTLVKVLTGLYRPEAGQLLVEGIDVTGYASKAIAYVPQEINLFDHLSVAENIFMPFAGVGGKRGIFSRKACENAALPIMKRLNMESRPSDLVKSISVAERQLLQVARALANPDFKVLILDEPTASLTKTEIDRLFEVIKSLKAEGRSVIFITHRLDEVIHLQNAVTVLRGGEVVGHCEGIQIDEDWIVSQMSGKDIDLATLYRPRVHAGDILMDVKGLCGDRFNDVSFSLREGEILGFAGLVGAGRTEIMQTLFGYLPKRGGEASFQGAPWVFDKPRRSIDNGVIYLSEERKTHGIFPNLSVRQNVGLGLLRQFSAMGIVHGGKEAATTQRIIADYNVKTRSGETKIVNLSGGNQQKVLIGRALEATPRILIMDEPTRGIDVGAKEEIYTLMQRIAEEQRMGIIVISSELEELIKCCNRVITIYSGRVLSHIDEAGMTMDALVSSVIGVDAKSDAVTTARH